MFLNPFRGFKRVEKQEEVLFRPIQDEMAHKTIDLYPYFVPTAQVCATIG